MSDEKKKRPGGCAQGSGDIGDRCHQARSSLLSPGNVLGAGSSRMSSKGRACLLVTLPATGPERTQPC